MLRLPSEGGDRTGGAGARLQCGSRRFAVRARVRPRGRCTDRLKLDRLGRSLPHLIESMTSLATRGVGFRSITEAIDTTTPGGRLVFTSLGPWGSSSATSSKSALAPDLSLPHYAAERGAANRSSPAKSLSVPVP
jgi:hypothetical protein